MRGRIGGMRLAKWQLRLIGIACIIASVATATYVMADWNRQPTWVKVGAASALVVTGAALRVLGRTIRRMS